MQQRIAIQGFEGSFHQEAARRFWGSEVEIIPCTTFREVVRIAAESDNCDGAVMAIENSIAGSILPNYNLLKQSGLGVIGEVYLEIRQDLMVLPGVTLEDVREVHSHPMAILQCLDFLDQYPHWKIVETEDTALSARHIAEHKSKHVAAIASSLAAGLYNLDRIRTDIHTLKNNYTRFLVLHREGTVMPEGASNKASVCFHVLNQPGSLSRVLAAMAGEQVNLSKLQSFPIPGSNWLYCFHADMEFEAKGHFERAIEVLEPLTEELKVYGVYQRGF